VCLWDNRWHKIACLDHPILGEEIPWLHQYNGDKITSHTSTPQPDKGKETASDQSINESNQRALDNQIRNSPMIIQRPLPSPTIAWTERYSCTYDPPAMVTQTSTEVEEKLATSFNKAFRRTDKGKETASEQSIDDSEQKALDKQIRNSPTVTQKPPLPPTPAWTKRYSREYDPPTMVTQTSSKVETKLAESFDKAFKRADEGTNSQLPEWRPYDGGGGPPDDGGGDGGGNGGGGNPPQGPPGGPPHGGDPAPAGPNLPPNLRPIPLARDTKPMGELPDVFSGD